MDKANEKEKEKEITQQLEILLGRHGRVTDPLPDRNVPILTELVNGPEWNPNKVTQPLAELTAAARLKRLSDQEIDTLSNDIFTRVLEKLDKSLAVKIEDRISAQMSIQLNSAITHVISDMRQEIANEIGDAVNAALADKLRR
jgi:hypothetical protein